MTKTELDLRLLVPFYTYLYFESEDTDRRYKRFIRDYVHYIDQIFCKAAIIVKSLMTEAQNTYTAFHIRR